MTAQPDKPYDTTCPTCGTPCRVVGRTTLSYESEYDALVKAQDAGPLALAHIKACERNVECLVSLEKANAEVVRMEEKYTRAVGQLNTLRDKIRALKYASEED